MSGGKRRFGVHSSVLATLVAVLADGVSHAQIIDRSSVVVPDRPAPGVRPPSAFDRTLDIPVSNRRYPAFEAHGVAFGPFDLFPALEIGPEYVSNTFASRSGERASFSLIARPEVVLRNRGGAIDIDIYGRGRLVRNLRFGTENTNEGTGGVDLTAPIGALGDAILGASVSAAVLPRYAPDSAASRRPMRYREIDAYVGTTIERGRFRLVARGDLANLQYQNATALDGTPLYAKDRDRQVLTGLVRVEYAVKPDISVYLAGTGSRIEFDLKPPAVNFNRNSTGWGGFVGASFKVTNLLSGDLRVGYIRQTFSSAVFRQVSGLGLKGVLRYFPTRLTTITLRGERDVQDSGVPGAAGLVHGGGEVEIDHELRRYLTANVVAGHYDDKFRGLARNDRNTFAAVSGTYLSGHHWNAKLGYQFMRRRSDGATNSLDFDDHRTIATLTFQL